ncbi:MAG TPA: hypothetical protein ENG74_03980, partial [Thermoplasmatales archaeon]|nr:hypothetical protein [Thermoplasmatales archaeon]
MDKANTRGLSKEASRKRDSSLRIFLDYRERNISDEISEIFDDIETRNLPVGDILLVFDDYAVLVERKSIYDLIDSIRSHRLWEQLLKLMKTEEIFGYHIKRKILLVHGSIRDTLLYEFDEKLWASLIGAFME